MDRDQASQALHHFADHPLTRVLLWIVTGACGLLITVSTAFAAYYAGDMRDSIDELKTTVKDVIERVDKLERAEEVRRAQWDAYREVYVQDVKDYRERQQAADAKQ